MCTFNKPFDWLDSLDPDLSRAIVDQAKRRAPEIMKKFRERESQIQQLRLDRIRAKEDKVKAREAKAVKDRLELIGKIDEMGGFWKTEEEMKKGLDKVKESAKGEGKGKQLESIKCQINYRRRIVEQPVNDPKNWTFSENGRQLNVESLSIKLARLIGQTASHIDD